MRAALLVAVVLCPLPIFAQAGHIYIDEDFSDWAEIEPLHENPEGAFFQRLWATNDQDYLYLSIEVAEERVLQRDDIVLWIDTDANSSTGLPIGDMGAELRWHFGDRIGTFAHGGTGTTVYHRHIGVVNAPTVSGTRFEIALSRDAQPDGQNPLFGSDEIRILFTRDEGDETLPAGFAGASFTFQNILRERTPVALSRHPAADLRVVAYNSEHDAILNPARQPAYARILPAIAPDLVGFSEIYNGTAQEIANAMDDLYPIDGTWYTAKPTLPGNGGNDLVLASRYPIIESHAIQWSPTNGTRTAVFLVDLRPDFDTDLLVFVSHPNCCDATHNRQIQLDAKMAWLREWKNDPSTEPGTPFMHIGDMNLVTYEYQRRTLLDGEIVNAIYQPSFDPDWDGSSLGDLRPLVTGAPMAFTWYRATSTFSPGRLDYIVYSGSTLESLGGFNLFTPTLTSEELAFYGLLAGDTELASDHLPVIGDFRMRSEISATDSGDAHHFAVGGAYPNPSAGSVRVPVSLAATGELRIEVLDVLGRRVWLDQVTLGPGDHHLQIDLGDVAAGVHVVRVSTESDTATRLITVTR